MKIYLYCLFFLFSYFPCVCQQLSNVRATVDSTTVTILYDLKSNIDGQLFTVDLYSSHNEFDSPLLFVSGDVGRNIQPGTDRKIVWQSKEIISFDGQISFDVRAVLTFPPFVVKSPKLASRYRRGKEYLIEWAGGIPTEGATLDLYRNKLKINSITATDNSGSHQEVS